MRMYKCTGSSLVCCRILHIHTHTCCLRDKTIHDISSQCAVFRLKNTCHEQISRTSIIIITFFLSFQGLNILLNSCCKSPVKCLRFADHTGLLSLSYNSVPLPSYRRYSFIKVTVTISFVQMMGYINFSWLPCTFRLTILLKL